MHFPRQRTGDPLGTTPLYGEHALVLGASMSGILAARVLADHFARVTLVERDRLPTDGRPRRGVPQGRHAHLLLAPGAHALDELFPGVLAELVEAGVPVARSLDQLHVEIGGHVFCQGTSPASTGQESRGALFEPSRPFLEATLLRRVQDLGNVDIMDACDVLGLSADYTLTRVTGARVEPNAVGHAPRDVLADLVVAATGRSGRLTAWLKRMGYPAPVEEEVDVDLTYASQRFRIPGSRTEPLTLVAVGASADWPRGAAALAQEDGTWIVTLFGYAGHHPPLAFEDWLAFADTVLPRRIRRALRVAKPVGEVQQQRFPANIWRRFDKLHRFPEGLVALGDAVCALNPVYGQGMTVAALEALALRDVLRAGSSPVAPRFFEATARPIGEAWRFAVGGDLQLPASVVPGARPLRMRAVRSYIDRAHAVAEHDPVMAWRILDAMGFAEPRESLFTTDSLRRVAMNSRVRRRTEVAAAPHLRQVWP